jgi:tight adherence protein B
VVTQRQIGGNLAHIMDGIAQNLKDRINIEQEVKANSAQGRLAGLVVGGLPILVGMIIYTTSPDYLAVFFQPEGRMLLIVAIVLELLGIIVIRKIVSIEY